MLLLLLLLPPAAHAQSGDADRDGDGDMEPRISCTSDILVKYSSLTCRLLAHRRAGEDDEDDGDDGMEKMTACYMDYSLNQRKCNEALGDTVTGLSPLPRLDVSILLKTGRTINTTVELMKIIKPRSPRVKDVSFNTDSDQAELHIWTPYDNEYPKEYLHQGTLLFELKLWAAGSSITQNVTSDTLRIDLKRLGGHREWRVSVRALPVNGMQGTWSDWSETFGFLTPAEENVPQAAVGGRELSKLIVCLVVLVVVPSSVLLFWKNKIFSYIWPSIPHPKHTLVHICKPSKGLLLNFRPEVFSALNLEKSEDQPQEEAEPPPGAAPGSAQSSAQSSDPSSASTTSADTEELELSALLSPTSSDGEDSLQSVQDLQPGDRPEGPGSPEASCSSGGNESEAYVTMSSFYRIQ
ncbi:interleukin-7 receptor subunit alpha [Centropristis striata]|uniref:interleukin-7 receptor subunit alpha n=1 Tax=Centropristis striata TaxID=184440 RepID=UPI0027E0323A|nr:interleukin-7 receptor subunit alpha [Centropristis striata]